LCPTDSTTPKTFDTPPDASFAPVGTGNCKTVALHNYSASRGANELYNNPSCSCTSNWNSYAIDGPFEVAGLFSGPFTRRGVCLPVSEIRDGLSNTIFFGEVLPMSSWHADNGWATSNNGNGYVSTLIPINYDTSIRDSSTTDNCRRFCNMSTAEGFKSSHPGGCSFVYGDGSVHFLPETINYQTYRYLGAKNDGQPITEGF
jgi:hypothetical protein